MNTLRTIGLIWSAIVGLGTLVSWIRLDQEVRAEEGAKLSFAASLGYAACTALSGFEILQPHIPEWWSWTVAPAGALILVLGQALGFCAKRALGGGFSPRLSPAAGRNLVTAGPFRLCRHPFALGFLMTWIGTTIVLGSPLMFVVFGFISILVMRRVALEEERLELEFGTEHSRYREQVPLITPCLDPLSSESKEIERAAALLRGDLASLMGCRRKGC